MPTTDGPSVRFSTTTSMKTCRSFTHVLSFDEQQVKQRQLAEMWLSDQDIYPDAADGDEGSKEKNNVLTDEANPDKFLEQHCFIDLDEDGLEKLLNS